MPTRHIGAALGRTIAILIGLLIVLATAWGYIDPPPGYIQAPPADTVTPLNENQPLGPAGALPTAPNLPTPQPATPTTPAPTVAPAEPPAAPAAPPACG